MSGLVHYRDHTAYLFVKKRTDNPMVIILQNGFVYLNHTVFTALTCQLKYFYLFISTEFKDCL